MDFEKLPKETQDTVKSFLRADVREVYEAAETIKQFCNNNDCARCAFKTNEGYEGCLFMVENETDTPAGWNINAIFDD